MMARKQKVVKKLVGGVGMKMKEHHVTVIKSCCHISKAVQLQALSITAGEDEIVATNLLICTGSEAFHPSYPGIRELPVIVIVTNREILDLKKLNLNHLVSDRWWCHRNGVCQLLQQSGDESHHR